MSQAVYDKIKDSELAKEKNRFSCLGRFEMPDAPDTKGAKLWELRVPGLEGRFFGGTVGKRGADDDGESSSNDGSSGYAPPHACLSRTIVSET